MANLNERKYSYGLDGLMRLVGCSKTTAWRIKRSGLIDEAIIQVGRKIIIDEEKALECMKKAHGLARA